MVIIIKENFKMVKNMVREFMYLMEKKEFIRDNGLKIKNMEKANLYFLIMKDIMGFFKKVRCLDREDIHMLMETFMMEDG
jgi:hypothetical protein